ncbi:MAG TPA: type II toxin-antitoxin system Phd/YefM family antitoxin [Promineifilum sp.]
MLKVAVDRIVSVTDARSRLSELVDEAKSDEFWVLTKGGKPRVALIDVAYLDDLIRRAWFNELATQTQTAFDVYLRKEGVNPDEADEKTIEILLASD